MLKPVQRYCLALICCCALATLYLNAAGLRRKFRDGAPAVEEGVEFEDAAAGKSAKSRLHKMEAAGEGDTPSSKRGAQDSAEKRRKRRAELEKARREVQHFVESFHEGAIPRAELVNGTRLCSRLKRLPELYVLGAPRTGTTTVKALLEMAGFWFPGGAVNATNFVKLGDEPGDECRSMPCARNRWFKDLPRCAARNKDNKVLVDSSTTYLSGVPLEPYMKTAEQLQIMWKESVPMLLNTMYGPLQQAPAFVAVLRDPLSRMMSSWYAQFGDHNRDERGILLRQTGFCKLCEHTFTTAIQKTMIKARIRDALVRGIRPWLWYSLYARHIEHWRLFFKASQFHVLLRHRIHQDMPELCRALAASLVVDVDCAILERLGLVALEKKLEGQKLPWLRFEDRQLFNSIMDIEIQDLVEGLTSLYASGGQLVGFHGRAQPELVQAWLEDGW
mmetsp:Transcript_39585/g.93255  ORF Transcript_39585/g.93255 Transcript_39585/m.93255 type:complete len:446 (+) Transcript_39585:217-1554(+)